MLSFIETYSGKQFKFLNPTAASIDIIDIAHALSLMCRFCGHSRYLYSIADHSLRVSSLVSQKNKLVALLHDSAEAYIGDISRPLKYSLPEISIIEKDIRDAIFEKFNVGKYDEAEVIKADDIMLATEAKYFMSNWETWKLSEKPIENYFFGMPTVERSNDEFLKTFRSLTK